MRRWVYQEIDTPPSVERRREQRSDFHLFLEVFFGFLGGIMKKIGLVILVLCLIILPTFAEGKQLGLETSSVAEGQKDVSVTPEIELVFTNNVINMKVKDHNEALIHMLDDKGNKVPVVIEMADDQVAPEMKRIVHVKVENALEEATDYTLVIQKGFMSKNGSEIPEDINLNFQTKGSGVMSVTTILLFMVVALLIGVRLYSRKRKHVKE